MSSVSYSSGAIISTERLELIPFESRFLTERYVSWLNDPLVTRFSNQRFQLHSLESCRQYVASFQDSDDILWAIVRKADEQHIGNLSAAFESSHQLADLSILIGESSAWGGGFGAEAWQAGCDYLFQQCNLRKVTGGTLAINHGMIRVMQKSGMQEEGRRLRHYLVDGQEIDMVYFGKFASR